MKRLIFPLVLVSAMGVAQQTANPNPQMSANPDSMTTNRQEPQKAENRNYGWIGLLGLLGLAGLRKNEARTTTGLDRDSNLRRAA